MSGYIFEEIGQVHIEEILEIYNYYVLNTTVTFHAKPLSKEEMKELVLFKNSKYKSFVITKNGNIYGYTILTQYKKREAYDKTAEVTIYLKPDYIGQGIGIEGLKHIEEYARTNRFHVLIATICGQNTASINLFEKQGYFKCAHYKEVGTKFGQLLDVVAYQKIL